MTIINFRLQRGSQHRGNLPSTPYVWSLTWDACRDSQQTPQWLMWQLASKWEILALLPRFCCQCPGARCYRTAPQVLCPRWSLREMTDCHWGSGSAASSMVTFFWCNEKLNVIVLRFHIIVSPQFMCIGLSILLPQKTKKKRKSPTHLHFLWFSLISWQAVCGLLGICKCGCVVLCWCACQLARGPEQRMGSRYTVEVFVQYWICGGKGQEHHSEMQKCAWLMSHKAVQLLIRKPPFLSTSCSLQHVLTPFHCRWIAKKK